MRRQAGVAMDASAGTKLNWNANVGPEQRVLDFPAKTSRRHGRGVGCVVTLSGFNQSDSFSIVKRVHVTELSSHGSCNGQREWPGQWERVRWFLSIQTSLSRGSTWWGPEWADKTGDGGSISRWRTQFVRELAARFRKGGGGVMVAVYGRGIRRGNKGLADGLLFMSLLSLVKNSWNGSF